MASMRLSPVRIAAASGADLEAVEAEVAAWISERLHRHKQSLDERAVPIAVMYTPALQPDPERAKRQWLPMDRCRVARRITLAQQKPGIYLLR